MEYQVNFNTNKYLIVKDSSKQQNVDLQKRLLRFSVNIVKFLFCLPALREFDVIRYQLSKSASSIGANYAESQATSYGEFYHRIQICLREARETHYWLEIIRDLELLKQNFKIKDQSSYEIKLEELIQESKEINLIFGAISTKIKKTRKS